LLKKRTNGSVRYCQYTSQYGNRYMYKGFNEMWVEARNRAGKISGILTDFTFHDLKAKGISDYEGSSRDKQLFSGHKTEGQVLIGDASN
ncbi:hypothetical protein UL79_23320, partial [Shigella dysenteriae]